MQAYRSSSGFFFQAEDGIRDRLVTGVQTCALPILNVVESNNLSNKEALAAYTETPVVSFSQDNLETFCSEIEKLV